MRRGATHSPTYADRQDASKSTAGVRTHALFPARCFEDEAVKDGRPVEWPLAAVLQVETMQRFDLCHTFVLLVLSKDAPAIAQQ